MPRPSFYKLILTSTIRERKLRIPENFVKKFKDELSVTATLMVPNGNVSRVGLKRADNKIWFHDGWQEFMERYAIRIGYFLVFRYEGNSVFSVHIYNLPSSEINYQSNAYSRAEVPTYGRHFRVFEEMEDDESEFVDHLTLNKTFNPPPLQNLLCGSKMINSVTYAGEGNLHRSKVTLYSPDGELQRLKKAGRKKRKFDPNNQETSAQDEHEDGGEMRFRFYESASARKRTVTAEERERAINAAKAFEPTNPFCRVVLRPSYLYRGCIMYLPSCFAEKHLNGISGFIKLQISDGRQWPVRCLYKGGRAKFSQGWYEFTLENNLGEGDVCIFEVLRMREFVLKVTLFRILESAGYVNRLPQ